MIDVSDTIIAKSDQLNADDLVEPITIRVREVTKFVENGAKCFSVKYEGDEGRPFKPCKTVRRILVRAWGKDATQWTGRLMTLFCDPSVKWGGKAVGGIRVSHLSHINGVINISLSETRGMKKPHTIKPLANEVKTQSAPPPANPPPKQDLGENAPNIRLLKADGSEITFDNFQAWIDFMANNLPKITDLQRVNSFKSNHANIFQELKDAGFSEWVEKAEAIITDNINRLGGGEDAAL